jgi:hypothetical protein
MNGDGTQHEQEQGQRLEIEGNGFHQEPNTNTGSAPAKAAAPTLMEDKDPGQTKELKGVRAVYAPNAGYFLNVTLRRGNNIPQDTKMEFIDACVPVKVFRSNKITRSSGGQMADITEVYTALVAYQGDFSSGSSRCTGENVVAHIWRKAVTSFWISFLMRNPELMTKEDQALAESQNWPAPSDTDVEFFNLAGVWRPNNSFGAFNPDAMGPNQRQFVPQAKPTVPGPNMAMLTRGIRAHLFNGEVRTLIGEQIFAARINSGATRGDTGRLTL